MAADPMYRQIAEDLRVQIEEGGLRPGQQLRTELELREKYNASRNTVRDAIKWLITRGLVETRPGQGTFVIERINPFVTTLSKDPETGGGSDEDRRVCRARRNRISELRGAASLGRAAGLRRVCAAWVSCDQACGAGDRPLARPSGSSTCVVTLCTSQVFHPCARRCCTC